MPAFTHAPMLIARQPDAGRDLDARAFARCAFEPQYAARAQVDPRQLASDAEGGAHRACPGDHIGQRAPQAGRSGAGRSSAGRR